MTKPSTLAAAAAAMIVFATGAAARADDPSTPAPLGCVDFTGAWTGAFEGTLDEFGGSATTEGSFDFTIAPSENDAKTATISGTLRVSLLAPLAPLVVPFAVPIPVPAPVCQKAIDVDVPPTFPFGVAIHLAIDRVTSGQGHSTHGALEVKTGPGALLPFSVKGTLDLHRAASAEDRSSS
jgi:hypothetical protein